MSDVSSPHRFPADLPSFAANVSEEDKEYAGCIYERWVTAVSAALIEICKNSSDFREAICEAATSVVLVGLPRSGDDSDKMFQLSFENKVLVAKFDCYYFFHYPDNLAAKFEAIIGKLL